MPACHAGGRGFESRPVRKAQPLVIYFARGFFIYFMSFQVYILQSLVDSSYYIGYTKDLNHRILQHNRAKTGYSSRKIPWKIVYTESYEDKTLAIKRERFLKNQKSRDFIQKLISI
jgi:putative endonuclease